MKGLTRYLVAIAILLLPLAATPGFAACTASVELETYLKERIQLESNEKLRVLAFNHNDPNNRWLAGIWDGNTLDEKALENDLAFDVNRKPRLSLGGGDKILVVVYNTNPMLFVVDPGKTEEVDVESLAQFKQLTGLLGGVIQSALVTNKQFSLKTLTTSDALQPELTGLSELEQIRAELLRILKGRATQVGTQLEEIQTAQGSVQRNSQVLESATFTTRAYLRGLETEQQVPTLVKNIQNLDTLAGKIDDSARILAEKALPRPVCTASYSAANDALGRKLNGFAKDKRVEQELEFEKNLRRLEDNDTTKDNCPSEDRRILDKLRLWLDANRPADQASPAPKEANTLREMKGILQDYQDQLARVAQVSTVTAQLLTAAPAAAKVAQTLATLLPRETAAISRQDSQGAFPREVCSLSTGVVQVFKGNPGVRALKFQKRKFAVKASAPLAADLEKRHKDLEAVDYELDSKFFNDFSLGFGVIHTDIASPSWSAVAHEPSGKMVIRQTDEETRAGEAALILSFAPQQRERFAQLGFDLGAALDTDNPTALAGLSVSFGRFVRLGGGLITSRIKRLDDGQREFRLLADGTPDPESVVTKTEDIRKKDTFKEGWYLSLTFSLNSLPFFRPE